MFYFFITFPSSAYPLALASLLFFGVSKTDVQRKRKKYLSKFLNAKYYNYVPYKYLYIQI